MKKLSILFTLIFGLTLLFNACQDMEDIHSEYLRDGDIIYAPKPLIIETFAGHNRIALKYYLINAVNINKCVIEWEDGTNTKTIDITPSVPLDSVDIILTDMEEKSYIFKIHTIDKFGNRSIKEQVTGSSYAAKYLSGLTNRPLVSIEGGGTTDSLIVTWGTAQNGNTGVELMYKNGAGEMVSKMVRPEDDITIIKDWESESEMSYKSFFIPEETAIDTFVVDPNSVTLPAFIEFKGEKIEKTNWEIVDFSTEEPGEGAPNGLASAAIDNDLSTFWHTQWDGASPGYPHFFTVDMKDVVKINKIETFRRPGDNRGQTRFEIHTSLDGVNYTNQGSFEYDPNSASQIYQFGKLPMARYIKYTATAGSNFFAFLAELDIYGQVATKLNRSEWSVVDFSTEEPGEGAPNGLVTAALDGDIGTFWHTQWDGASPGYPHFFTVDLKKTVKILAVDCARRQGDARGQTKFKIYTSNDGVTFDDQGTFNFNSNINDAQMFPLSFLPNARYVKYEAVEGPNFFAFLAEFNVYGSVAQ